jgi:formylmethanofuran dehydrogenase subunit D
MTGARVKFTCPDCGDVMVPTDRVSVAMSDEFLWVAMCPYCSRVVHGETNSTKVAELVHYGARVNSGSVAEEAEKWLIERTKG